VSDFNPYDDAIPVGERLGSQRLYEPEPVVEPSPEPGEVVQISKRLLRRRANASEQPLKPVQQPSQPTAGKPRVDRREWSSTALEVGGLSSFSAGFWFIPGWVGVMLGLIVSGLCLVLLGVATSNQLGRPRD
jgi:hypothetical protein